MGRAAGFIAGVAVGVVLAGWLTALAGWPGAPPGRPRPVVSDGWGFVIEEGRCRRLRVTSVTAGGERVLSGTPSTREPTRVIRVGLVVDGRPVDLVAVDD